MENSIRRMVIRTELSFGTKTYLPDISCVYPVITIEKSSKYVAGGFFSVLNLDFDWINSENIEKA